MNQRGESGGKKSPYLKNRKERRRSLSRSPGLRFFLVTAGVFFNVLSPVAIFDPSVLEQFGMDAIMLQEKLVERLLCPRVRTARQKVKKIIIKKVSGNKLVKKQNKKNHQENTINLLLG